MAHDETHDVKPERRWLIPATAAASVALIGGIIWGVTSGGSTPAATPAATQAATSTTEPTSAPTTSAAPTNTAKTNVAPTNAAPTSAGQRTVPKAIPTVSPKAEQSPATVQAPPSPPTPTPDRGGPLATRQIALPAYFVGASSGAGDRFGLYREFVRTTAPTTATASEKARAAVAVAMNAQPFTAFEPYIQPWSSTSVTNVAVTPSRITITLSGPGAPGFTAAQTRLAVQQLVWTAQAAVGQGTIPVKFAVANGSPRLFGTYPTAKTYNRPATSMQYEVLAPIWITSPVRDQVLPAAAPATISGQSCAFEGTTQWQLRKGGATLRSGTTTASSECPMRGTWQVKLGALPAGSYTFRMFEVSMEDGQGVIAETSRPFTVK